MKKGSPKGSKESAAARRIKTFELRKDGASYRVIATQLGISPASAFSDVKAVLASLKEFESETAEDYRTLELERLDTVQFALKDLVIKGDLKAIDRFLRISETRCKLLGLYNLPVKGTSPVSDKDSWDEITETT